MEFDELFSASAGPAFERQLALAELLGERGWSMDLSQGVVRFGDDLQFEVQLLGSENDQGNWLWAWANSQSNLPDELLQAVQALRMVGEQEEVELLTTPQFDLPEGLEGHHLAMVASEVLGGHPYYRGPYPGGALYFLVVGVDPEALSAARPRALLPSTIGQVIQAFDVDHAVMVASLLAAQGFELQEDDEEGGIAGEHPDGGSIRVTFDDEGRVDQITGSFGPG